MTSHDGRGGEVLNPYEEQMGSTTLDDADLATMAGFGSSQYIDIDRGNHGRVRVDGRT